jgi:hypothetical protein
VTQYGNVGLCDECYQHAKESGLARNCPSRKSVEKRILGKKVSSFVRNNNSLLLPPYSSSSPSSSSAVSSRRYSSSPSSSSAVSSRSYSSYYHY